MASRNSRAPGHRSSGASWRRYSNNNLLKQNGAAGGTAGCAGTAPSGGASQPWPDP